MAYTTLAAIKLYAGIASDNTRDDALLSSLLVSAQAMIDAACNRTFEAAADSDRRFDCPDTRRLVFDTDLCALTAIVNGDSTAVALTDVVMLPRTLTPWYALELKTTADSAWAFADAGPESAIVVSGRWAYSETAPAAIQHACLRLVSWLYRQKDNQAEIDRPVVSPDGMILMPGTLPNDVRDILTAYRRH